MATFSKMPVITAGHAKRTYDVAIVGGQMAGALAGALLQKRGYRVLLVEHDGMGPGYEHNGFLLPYSPFVAPSLRGLPAAEEALTELAVTTHVLRIVKPHVPELQLVFPNKRLDLHRDDSKRLGELQREFGAEGHLVLDALKALAAYRENSDGFFRKPPPLPTDGFFEAMSLKSALKRHPHIEAPLPQSSHPVFQLICQMLPFVSNLDSAGQPLALGRPLSQVLSQSTRYPGGREGLRDLFVKRLSELGGQVLSRESAAEGFIAEQILFDGDKVSGVKILNSDAEYGASALIFATDSGALRRLIEDKKRNRKLVEQLDLSSHKRYLFTVNWVLRPELLPRGMGELLLVETEDGSAPLLIQVQPAHRVGKPEEDTLRVVCAGTFVSAATRELGEPFLQQTAEAIAQKLDGLLPFAKEKLVLSSSPYLDASGVRGSRLSPHPLFSVQTEAPLGVEGLTQKTAIKNLILANREVLPGLGLEGEFLAALQAAEAVQDMLKKRVPLRR